MRELALLEQVVERTACPADHSQIDLVSADALASCLHNERPGGAACVYDGGNWLMPLAQRCQSGGYPFGAVVLLDNLKVDGSVF